MSYVSYALTVYSLWDQLKLLRVTRTHYLGLRATPSVFSHTTSGELHPSYIIHCYYFIFMAEKRRILWESGVV